MICVETPLFRKSPVYKRGYSAASTPTPLQTLRNPTENHRTLHRPQDRSPRPHVPKPLRNRNRLPRPPRETSEPQTIAIGMFLLCFHIQRSDVLFANSSSLSGAARPKKVSFSLHANSQFHYYRVIGSSGQIRFV